MNTLDDLFKTEKPNMSTLKKAPEIMILFANRDLVHDQLLTKVRLNRYDMKFMVNISEKYLGHGKPLSPGQNELYEKIVHKYRKQLRKLKINYRDLLALPWVNGIVSPEVLNEKTFFRLVEEDMRINMNLYFNFNKGQIEEIRALIHDDEGNHLNRGNKGSNFGNGQKYDYNWSNSTKTWSGPFNLYLFKGLYEFAKAKHVQVEQSVQDIADTLDAAGTLEQWTPSIRIVHDRLYISHIAETMLPVLDTIDPTDLSFKNVERLTKLGLTAPADFKDVAKYINSASSEIKHIVKDAADVEVLKDYVQASGRKVIFHIPELSTVHKSRNQSSVIKMIRDCNNWPNTRHFNQGQISSTSELDKIFKEGYNTLITSTPLAGLIRSQSELGKFALKADKVIYISLTETT